MFSYDDIYVIVEQIPEGKVATYGTVAALAGCTARQAGYALSALPVSAPIPWHRVINSKGRISMRNKGTGDATQRMLLEAEGIRFNDKGVVDLYVYGWDSGDTR